MNKRLFSIIFMISAAVVNFVIIIFFVLLDVAILLFLSKFLPKDFMFFLTISSLISAVLLSFIVYHKLLTFVREKYDLDKYMDNVFKSSKNK